MVSSQTKPRTRINGLNTGHGKRSAEIKIATWNTTSLFRTGACQNLVETLDAYTIDIAALQEIRWTGVEQIKVGHYIIYFSGLVDRHHFRTGFAVHEKLEPYVKEFISVSERIACLKLNTTPLNIMLVCVHAPTEKSKDEVKDEFYNKLDETWDSLRGHLVKLLLGDLNAKYGREPQYAPIIGKESLHAISNSNGLRLISFSASNNIVVRSTTFPRKNIHKATWKSPGGNTLNQIDHILIENRFRSRINNIRSYRGADIDTEHFLLISKFKLKL